MSAGAAAQQGEKAEAEAEKKRRQQKEAEDAKWQKYEEAAKQAKASYRLREYFVEFKSPKLGLSLSGIGSDNVGACVSNRCQHK